MYRAEIILNLLYSIWIVSCQEFTLAFRYDG